MNGPEIVHEIPDPIGDETLDKIERYCELLRLEGPPSEKIVDSYVGRPLDLLSPRRVHAIILRLRDAEDEVIGYANERGSPGLPYPERITPISRKWER